MSSTSVSFFASSFFGKTVIDKSGKPIGTLHDLAMTRGEALPHISSLIVSQGKAMVSIPWAPGPSDGCARTRNGRG